MKLVLGLDDSVLDGLRSLHCICRCSRFCRRIKASEAMCQIYMKVSYLLIIFICLKNASKHIKVFVGIEMFSLVLKGVKTCLCGKTHAVVSRKMNKDQTPAVWRSLTSTRTVISYIYTQNKARASISIMVHYQN